MENEEGHFEADETEVPVPGLHREDRVALAVKNAVSKRLEAMMISVEEEKEHVQFTREIKKVPPSRF